METFHTIVTHENPHLDEIAAIWLLRKFGEKKFPGISTAKVEFLGTGGETLDGRSAQDYEREGILFLGIGGGRFDEHPSVNGERKENECTATLVAKTLGIDDDPSLEKVLKFVVNTDLKGAGHPFDLGCIVKLLYQQYPDYPERGMEWVMTGLEAKYQEQLEFLTITKADFEKNAEIEKIPGPGGRILKMICTVSDDPKINKFARSVFGGNADIVVQKQSSGNVQIFTNAQSGLVLYDAAQMINLAEQEAEGEVKITDWKTLSAEGMIPDGRWFFQHKGQMLLNGSLTATQVPPTQLSLEKIKEIVRIGVNPWAFCPKRAENCKQGFCTSTPDNPCPWYQLGLHRCRKIRFQMKNS